MEEEVLLTIDLTKETMEKSIAHLESELIKIRAGKANPAMLEGIHVDYYGSHVPLSQVSNINTLDAKTIAIQPWEKKMLEVIGKAIMAANIGLHPQNNGEFIIINVPPLTEERRRNLVKQTKGEGEKAKISIRNARRDANEEIKKMQKSGLAEDDAKNTEEEIQQLTDNYIKKVDVLILAKEKDIMTV